MTAYAAAGHTLWAIVLAISFGAAVLVAVLLTLLVEYVGSIETSIDGLREVAAELAGNTARVPELAATAPVLAEIAAEASVQEGYLSALTEGAR